MPRAATLSRLLPTVLAAILCAWFGANDASAQDAASIRARAQEILQDTRYQRELPGESDRTDAGSWPDSPRSGSGGGRRDATRRAAERPDPADTAEPSRVDDVPYVPRAPASTVSVALWVVVGGLVIAFVVWILTQRRRAAVDVSLTPEGDGVLAAAGGASAAARGPLTVAERALELAEEGQLTEAVHLLLLDALAQVTGRRVDELADATTSREILAGDDVEARDREPLGVLVRTVEISLFAGRPLERREFDAALVQYRSLAAER